MNYSWFRKEKCPLRHLIFSREGQVLQILVENQGRIGFGPHPAERKGIVSPVKLGKTNLRGWDAYSMPLKDAKALSRFVHGRVANATVRSGGWSAFWLGNFSLPCGEAEARDTFLRLDGWGKGVAFVNGFNLGRYWPAVGPQVRRDKILTKRTALLNETIRIGDALCPSYYPAASVPPQRDHNLRGREAGVHGRRRRGLPSGAGGQACH